jgi:hypothetical protein
MNRKRREIWLILKTKIWPSLLLYSSLVSFSSPVFLQTLFIDSSHSPSLTRAATWRTICIHRPSSGRHFYYFLLIPREAHLTQLSACLAVMSGRMSFISFCISHVENLQLFAFTLCMCGRLKWSLSFLLHVEPLYLVLLNVVVST